jgi:hypothetical protein
MATPSVPAAPPAAPAAAPSTTAPAASSTPAAPPASVETPVAAPVAPAAPAGPPKNTDFPDSAEGQVQFLAKLKEYEKANPAKPAAEAAAAIADSLGAQPGEKKPEPAAAKPEGEAQPAPPKPDPTAVPKAIADLLEAKPERKAFVDADPELKGILFGNARRLAAIEPIAQIVPTVEDANFMAEHTSAMVGLQTASMRMIDMPETAPQVLEMLDRQFAVTDKDGKPVVGADGKPTYAEDRRPFLDAIVNREVQAYRQQFTGEIAQLKTKLASGVYPNEAAKAMDTARLERLELANLWTDMYDQIRTGDIFKQDAPEVPENADPAFKTWAEAEKKRIADENAALEAKKQGASKEQRTAEKTQFNGQVRETYAKHCGQIIGETLKQHLDSGGYIPEFYLQQKHVNPATGEETKTSALVVRIFTKFENDLMKPGSRTLKEIVQHELLPPTPQTKEIRDNYYKRQAADMLPGIINAEIKRIEELVKVDNEKQGKRLQERQAVVQPEPATGSGKSGIQSREQKMQTAEANAKRNPTFAAASDDDKQARILTEYHRL